MYTLLFFILHHPRAKPRIQTLLSKSWTRLYKCFFTGFKIMPNTSVSSAGGPPPGKCVHLNWCVQKDLSILLWVYVFAIYVRTNAKGPYVCIWIHMYICMYICIHTYMCTIRIPSDSHTSTHTCFHTYITT